MKSKSTKKNIIYLSNRNSLLYFSIGALISSIFVSKLSKIEESNSDYEFKGKSINTLMFVFVFLILIKLLDDKEKKKVQECDFRMCKEKGFCHDSMDILFGMFGSFTILGVSSLHSCIRLNMIISFIPIIFFIIFKAGGIWNGVDS